MTKVTDIPMPTQPSSNQPFHTEVIQLPSQGLLYPESNPLSAGNIEMRYMTAKEEDILTSQNLLKSGLMIDKLLQSLIVSKIDYNSLFVGDKNAILIAARALAYGKDYEVEITCPSCNKKSKHVIDIAAFEDKSPDPASITKGVNEFVFQLPASKRTVSFKCLTVADEKAIDSELKALKKVSAMTGIDSEMTTRLKYIITAVDGNTDDKAIRKFVDTELLSRDSLALRKQIQSVTPDVKMNFVFTCSNCDHEELEMPMPMTTDFFWPRA